MTGIATPEPPPVGLQYTLTLRTDGDQSPLTVALLIAFMSTICQLTAGPTLPVQDHRDLHDNTVRLDCDLKTP